MTWSRDARAVVVAVAVAMAVSLALGAVWIGWRALEYVGLACRSPYDSAALQAEMERLVPTGASNVDGGFPDCDGKAKVSVDFDYYGTGRRQVCRDVEGKARERGWELTPPVYPNEFDMGCSRLHRDDVTVVVWGVFDDPGKYTLREL